MMKQKMQNLSQKFASGLRFITNPILRVLAALWAVTPLGMAWAALPPKARRAFKVFGLTFGLTWFAGAAWAANGGVSGVFPARPGLTLANSVDPFQLWQDKTAEPPGNVPADIMIGLAGMIFIAVASFAWVIGWLMTGMIGGSSAFEDAVDVSPMISGAMAELSGWLLPTCLATGAVMTFIDFARQKTNGFNGVLTFVALSICALGLGFAPKAYIDGLGLGRDIGQKVVSTVVDASPASATQPFEWPTNYSSDNATKSFALQVQDSFWRSFIITPWCIGEFGGDMGLCKQHGAAVLKKTKYDERHSYYENEVINKQKDNQHLQKILKGDDWSGRVGLVLFGALIALIGSVLVCLLVFNALIAWFQAVLLLFLGVFFLPFGIIPGLTRTWLSNWAAKLVGAVVMNASLMLLLVSTMGVIAAVATSSAEWNQQLITEVGILFAAFGLKSTISQIVNAGGMGGGGLAQLLMIRTLTRTGAMSRRAASSAGRSIERTVRSPRPVESRPPRRAAIDYRRARV